MADEHTVHTDNWRGHTGYEELGFGHETVNHKTNFIRVLEDGTKVHTQNIEALWRTVKGNLNRLGAHRRKFTNQYIQTWAYRRNVAPKFGQVLFLLSRFRN